MWDCVGEGEGGEKRREIREEVGRIRGGREEEEGGRIRGGREDKRREGG